MDYETALGILGEKWRRHFDISDDEPHILYMTGILMMSRSLDPAVARAILAHYLSKSMSTRRLSTSYTVFTRVIRERSDVVLKFLLEEGLDADLECSCSQLVALAIEVDSFRCLRLLLEYWPPENRYFTEFNMVEAVHYGHYECAWILHKAGVGLDALGGEGCAKLLAWCNEQWEREAAFMMSMNRWVGQVGSCGRRLPHLTRYLQREVVGFLRY